MARGIVCISLRTKRKKNHSLATETVEYVSFRILNKRNLGKGYVKRFHLFRDITMPLKIDNQCQRDSTIKRSTSRDHYFVELQCHQDKNRIFVMFRSIWVFFHSQLTLFRQRREISFMSLLKHAQSSVVWCRDCMELNKQFGPLGLFPLGV